MRKNGDVLKESTLIEQEFVDQLKKEVENGRAEEISKLFKTPTLQVKFTSLRLDQLIEVLRFLASQFTGQDTERNPWRAPFTLYCLVGNFVIRRFYSLLYWRKVKVHQTDSGRLLRVSIEGKPTFTLMTETLEPETLTALLDYGLPPDGSFTGNLSEIAWVSDVSPSKLSRVDV